MKRNNIRTLNILGALAFLCVIIGNFAQSIILILSTIFTTTGGANPDSAIITVLTSIFAPFLSGMLPLIYFAVMTVQAIRKKQLKIVSAVLVAWETVGLFVTAIAEAILFIFTAITFIASYGGGVEWMSLISLSSSTGGLVASSLFSGSAYLLVTIVLLMQCISKDKPIAKKTKFVCSLPVILMVISNIVLLGSTFITSVFDASMGLTVKSLLDSALSCSASLCVMIPMTVAFELFCISVWKFQKIREDESEVLEATEVTETVAEETEE